MQIILRNGVWVYEPINDEDITEDTILAVDIENDTFTNSARALINNLAVTRVFNDIYQN